MSAPPPRSLRPLRRALSAPRLEGYRLGATETDLDLLARYAWNLALAEALYPALHYLEVVLRNALHSALARVHGDRWYVGPEVLVGAYVQDEVQRVLARVPDPLAPDAPDRVVAALPFGFWTTLLSKPYGRPPSRIAQRPHPAPLHPCGRSIDRGLGRGRRGSAPLIHTLQVPKSRCMESAARRAGAHLFVQPSPRVEGSPPKLGVGAGTAMNTILAQRTTLPLLKVWTQTCFQFRPTPAGFGDHGSPQGGASAARHLAA